MVVPVTSLIYSPPAMCCMNMAKSSNLGRRRQAGNMLSNIITVHACLAQRQDQSWLAIQLQQYSGKPSMCKQKYTTIISIPSVLNNRLHAAFPAG